MLLAKKLRMYRDRPLHALRNYLDVSRDKRICGVSLEQNMATTIGPEYYDTVHVPYGSLSVVFKGEKFTADDVFLDVGCGMGRPLAYMVDKKFPGKIEGVEINPPAAEFAQAWAEQYDNVEVISGDAFDIDLSEVTRYFMWEPMGKNLLTKFVDKMMVEATKPIRVYYLNGESREIFEDNDAWKLHRQGYINRVHGIPMHGSDSEYYGIWDFVPHKAA